MPEKENFYTKYLSKLNLYVIVIAVFMILTFVVGDSNLYVRYTYDDKIRLRWRSWSASTGASL